MFDALLGLWSACTIDALPPKGKSFKEWWGTKSRLGKAIAIMGWLFMIFATFVLTGLVVFGLMMLVGLV